MGSNTEENNLFHAINESSTEFMFKENSSLQRFSSHSRDNCLDLWTK